MRYPKVVKYGSMEYNTMVANQRNAEAALEKQKAGDLLVIIYFSKAK